MDSVESHSPDQRMMIHAALAENAMHHELTMAEAAQTAAAQADVASKGELRLTLNAGAFKPRTDP